MRCRSENLLQVKAVAAVTIGVRKYTSSSGELRVAQYEKPLDKGHRTTLKERREKQDPEKLAKRRTEKKERSAVLKEKIIKMIESGLQLSEYQARKAFTVYLQCILQVRNILHSIQVPPSSIKTKLPEIFQRLSDFDDESGDPSQIDLVLKFLQKVNQSLEQTNVYTNIVSRVI